MIFRMSIIFISLTLLWQGITSWLNLPIYILPGPLVVLKTFWVNKYIIFQQAGTTIIETFCGLGFGILFGSISALVLHSFRPVRLWFLPILLISQSLPTFAIAPILVLWFGYGMTAKIITTIIMLFFPVTNAFYDGLNRTPSAWLDLSKTMTNSKWRILWHIKVPAALPALATGIRVATVIAPIGAIVGEWVGSSKGLGFLMLNANARMQIDLMFAVLFVIVILTVMLYYVVDKLLNNFINWKT